MRPPTEDCPHVREGKPNGSAVGSGPNELAIVEVDLNETEGELTAVLRQDSNRERFCAPASCDRCNSSLDDPGERFEVELVEGWQGPAA